MSVLLSKNKIIHFSGICGTGMASLAVLLKMRGYKVRGSDENVYPPMSDFLLKNDISIQNGFILLFQSLNFEGEEYSSIKFMSIILPIIYLKKPVDNLRKLS